MPELPDVEAVARLLRRRISGRRIRRVEILDRTVVRSPGPARFARSLRGRIICRIGRRGKYLLMRLDGGAVLIGHLRMTGDFVVVPGHEAVHRHTRLVIGLDGDDLRFIDQRRFGHVDLVAAGGLGRFAGLRKLGVEPLTRAFTLGRLRGLIGARRGAVKGLLLRQDVIAGIGNLYADEILFRARLHPARGLQSLRPLEVGRLHRAIRSVLRRAIEGLSRRGRPVGGFVDVRERDGACPRCRGLLRIATVAGRTAYFCPRCQR